MVEAAGGAGGVARGAHVGLDDLGKRLVDVAGGLDGGAEAYGAAQGLDGRCGGDTVGGLALSPVVEVVDEQEVRCVAGLFALQGAEAAAGVLAVGGQATPAADYLRLVADVELGLVGAVGDDDARAGHCVLVDGEDDDAVVAEQPLLDGLGEGELVGDGAVLALVVH